MGSEDISKATEKEFLLFEACYEELSHEGRSLQEIAEGAYVSASSIEQAIKKGWLSVSTYRLFIQYFIEEFGRTELKRIENEIRDPESEILDSIESKEDRALELGIACWRQRDAIRAYRFDLDREEDLPAYIRERIEYPSDVNSTMFYFQELNNPSQGKTVILSEGDIIFELSRFGRPNKIRVVAYERFCQWYRFDEKIYDDVMAKEDSL